MNDDENVFFLFLYYKMDIKQIQKELKNQIKKNVTFEDQNNSKVGNNLKNTSDVNPQKIINIKKNLKKTIKNALLKNNEKKNVIFKKDDEDYENNIKQKLKKEFTSSDIKKINNIKIDLKNRFRNFVIKEKHVAEEQEKHFGPIINALKNVNTTINEVKDVAIKTDGDIQKLRVPYQPRNPEIQRLMSTEDNIQTPKSSQSSYSYNNSPLPKNTITLGDLATKYLPKIKDKCFGLYYDEEWDDHYIGKDPVKFENNDIILNGKTYKGTPGLWRLLTYKELIDSQYYTPEDLKTYKEILFETESIYQNNDKSSRNPKSSGSNKYKMMIKPMYNEIKTTTSKTKGGGLKKYTEDRVEYHYISNLKQLIDRLHFISAEEQAGNNNFHNEKLGILHLFKTIMENIIDTPEGIEYLENYVRCLPNEVKILKDPIIKKIYYILYEERKGNNNYHDEKLDILNICIREMEKLIDIPVNGGDYLSSFISHLPKKIITGSGIINYLLNCSNLPEMHWPGYNYLGPGTKLEKNKKPKNKLDDAAREHDYFYKYNKDTKTRHVADKILEQKAMERFYDPHSSLGEKTAAIVTANVMNVKRRLGMNLI